MRMRVITAIVFVGWFCTGGSAASQDYALPSEGGFWNTTKLRGLSFDGLNSHIVRQAARDSFELSDGGKVALSKWYSPTMPNISATFETKIGRDAALIWGGSLGESGVKYRLGPSGTIGFALRRPVGKRATLSLELLGQFGGALREETCIADYGALGGVQQVNCRLAATALPPKETLNYRWDEVGVSVANLRISYQVKF